MRYRTNRIVQKKDTQNFKKPERKTVKNTTICLQEENNEEPASEMTASRGWSKGKSRKYELRSRKRIEKG